MNHAATFGITLSEFMHLQFPEMIFLDRIQGLSGFKGAGPGSGILNLFLIELYTRQNKKALLRVLFDYFASSFAFSAFCCNAKFKASRIIFCNNGSWSACSKNAIT